MIIIKENRLTPEDVMTEVRMMPLCPHMIIKSQGSLLETLQSAPDDDAEFDLEEWNQQWKTVEAEMREITYQNNLREEHISEHTPHDGNYDRETLVAYLRNYGVTYLAPSDAIMTKEIKSEGELIRGLLLSYDPRLQMALVPLFIYTPRLSAHISLLVEILSPTQALDLKTYYMAAVYLHHIWQIRLGFYIDSSTLLPDLYSSELGLPPPEERFGKVGLHYLVEDWKQRSIFPFNYMASLNKTMDLFFAELKMRKGNQYASTNRPKTNRTISTTSGPRV